MIWWPVRRRDAHVCLRRCDDVTGEPCTAHLGHVTAVKKPRILGLHTSSLSLIFPSNPFSDHVYNTGRLFDKLHCGTNDFMSSFLKEIKRNISCYRGRIDTSIK